MSAPRRIAHLDMDAFFASVELLRYPELLGAAVVVGGRRADAPQALPGGGWHFARLDGYVGRGVATTATYAARAFGVHSGMGLMKAARLAPQAILLPADFTAYRHYSRLFKSAVAQLAPQIEDRGIDEIYIDLSALPDDSLTLARQLKAAVHAATGLCCSIGIAPNKLLAKIASDLDKPDGITVLGMDDVPTRIWPLPVGRINGIGPKAVARLATLGVATIGELADTDPAVLQAAFGSHSAAWLHRVARGIDAREVHTHAEPKSISRETTFERDLHPRADAPVLREIFNTLCAQVADDLLRKGYRGQTIGIKLRFDDFRTVTRDVTLAHATADARLIRHHAVACLRRVPLERRLRLLGVRIASLQASHRADAASGHAPPIQADLPL